MLRIKAERLAKGWTQTKLAAKADVSAAEISKIENGWIRPFPQQAARIARALRIAPDQLLEPATNGANG